MDIKWYPSEPKGRGADSRHALTGAGTTKHIIPSASQFVTFKP